MALEERKRNSWFNDAKEIDFLKELYKLGAWQVIHNILKLLGAQDLCRYARYQIKFVNAFSTEYARYAKLGKKFAAPTRRLGLEE